MTKVQFTLPARRRLLTGLIAASASAALLAGCGSNNDTSASPPAASATPAGSSPAQTAAKETAKAKAAAKSAAVKASSGSTIKVTHTTVLKLAADPTGKLMFIPTKLKAKAGKVTLIMTNPKTSGESHGVSLKGNGVDVDGAPTTPGGTSTVTATLQPGTYQYYCPVPGHAAAGMVGTLTVT